MDKQAEEYNDNRLYQVVAEMAGNFILRNGINELSDHYIREIAQKALKVVGEVEKQKGSRE